MRGSRVARTSRSWPRSTRRIRGRRRTAAVSLKKCQLSPPIHTQYGYHIIEALSDIRPAKTTSLDKVKSSIRQQLEQQQKQEQMTKWVDGTKKKFCKDDRIKYQVGYQPNPDPCAAILSNTSSTTATK